MSVSRVIRAARPFLRRHPGIKRALIGADRSLGRWKHSAATRLPFLIRPQPRQLTLAVTGACNLRCKGCRYGRDYMVGEQLDFETTLRVLDDAKAAGVNRVRYYGGEPLVHPKLPEMIAYSTRLGMDSYVTTNGLMLKSKIDPLYEAGMRWLTMGFYGVGEKYDAYTQRKGRFDRLVESLTYVRENYGDDVQMQLNWVLMRPTCNDEAFEEAWGFAERFDMFFHVDLVSYSLPFFHDGPEQELPFGDADEPMVRAIGDRLWQLKRAHPKRLPQSDVMIKAIPDLLLQGADMRLPCDAYDSLWVGADGTVQLCDVTFALGNVNEKRLKDMLFDANHRRLCRDAFALKCQNCTCKLDSRIQKHAPSVRRYR